MMIAQPHETVRHHAQAGSAPYGRGVYFGSLSAGRLRDRRPDIGHHQLAGPTFPGQSRTVGARALTSTGTSQDIFAASKAYAEALVVNEPKTEELIALYAMISRMRAMSSSSIIACDWRLLRAEPDGARIARAHQSGKGVDPLKDFAEAVREERREFAQV